jgi:zinc protease
VIGSIEDLEAASLDDVRAFHATYYRPDNAVLIVTGDFDPADLDRWVDKYFGPLTHPDTPIPARERGRAGAREVRAGGLTAPNVPLPAVC